MFICGPLSFFPCPLATAATLAVASAVAAVVRRPLIPPSSWLFFAISLLALVLAAGKPSWLRPSAQVVAVMIDLSPSTRGASFRDPAYVRRRVSELIGSTPFRVTFFANRNTPGALEGTSPLRDLPADRTIFAPPPAAAVLLFSDGRFDAAAASCPVYPVLDPSLAAVDDAAITRMEFRGGDVAVSVTSTGPPRVLHLHGTVGPTTIPVEGTMTVVRRADLSAAVISADVSPGDAWPENDAMSVRPTPPMASERWWVGLRPPGARWRAVAPADLPTDATAYLAPSAIVLNNVAASALSDAAQDRLRRYVRDLGGSLLILGGDRAFTAGGYEGTALESLSPLASSPPGPTTLWMVLADASGSMASAATSAGGATRWDLASAAVVRLLPHLPPEDPVRVGQFSETLRWWSDGKSARETAALPLPPADAGPHGPTNLEQVLQAIARDAVGSMPSQLLLLTDADVVIDDSAGLARALVGKKIRLHILAIGQGTGLLTLQKIAAATGGASLTQLDPSAWAASVQELLRAALPERLGKSPVTVRFIGPAASLAAADVAPWDRTWIKREATLLADATGIDGPMPMAATWRAGGGKVLAAAFAATPGQAEALADLIAQPPLDPRLKVTWDTGMTIRVAIDAVDGDQYLNGLDLTLDVRDASDAAESNSSPHIRPIPQAGPGRYEVSVAAPLRPAVATVRHGERIVQRLALAGRYPPEFDGVGADRGALEALAARTGGHVITPRETAPIDFDWPRRMVDLTPTLAAFAAACVVAGLVAWRRS